MLVEDIERSGAAPGLVRALHAAGLKGLYPPQAMAVEAGLFSGRGSFVIASPTASGKTLIAEMASIDMYLKSGGKTVYLAPLRALAGEKYDDLTMKYRSTGIKIVLAIGDYDSPGIWARDSDLVIATNEKLDSLIRHRAPWLEDIALVIADEIHLIGDSHRGPTLEIVLTYLRSLNPTTRIIALSATIPNAMDIAEWLGARLIASDWRPVPLREGVYYNGAGIFNDGTVAWIKQVSNIDAINIAMDTVRGSGQALVFVNTRKAAEAAALKAASSLSGTFSDNEKKDLAKLSGSILKAVAEPTRICRKLAECASKGAAFHHAGVSHAQRRLIEDAFRKNRVKILAATTTLALGLNLPSRRVIIKDWWRFEPGMGMRPIPVLEVKQMSGRAGRPGYDAYGEALLIARNRRDERFLFDNYIKGQPEEIKSRLASEQALRTHILALIAGGFARSKMELESFLKKTFFAAQAGIKTLSEIAREVTLFLKKEELVTEKKGVLYSTRFGRRTSELYIDPLTAVLLRDGLSMEKEKSDFALFHAIARTPDMPSLSLKRKDRDLMVNVFFKRSGELLVPKEEAYPAEELLSELKTACVLMDWIEEEKEDSIVGRYDIGPGDVRTVVELGDWLLYSAHEMSKIFGMRQEAKLLSTLRVRVRYGVRPELLELVSLKGLGRVRARNLFNSGYMGIKDIRKASVDELSKVPAIGKTVAQSIKAQAQGL